ncbi:hypothetical protein M0R36_10595 [bacterium]|jgi:uncharacterized protein YacL (UPF0231 family)|nr:hypothetical protein [bacterium]
MNTIPQIINKLKKTYDFINKSHNYILLTPTEEINKVINNLNYDAHAYLDSVDDKKIYGENSIQTMSNEFIGKYIHEAEIDFINAHKKNILEAAANKIKNELLEVGIDIDLYEEKK